MVSRSGLVAEPQTQRHELVGVDLRAWRLRVVGPDGIERGEALGSRGGVERIFLAVRRLDRHTLGRRGVRQLLAAEDGFRHRERPLDQQRPRRHIAGIFLVQRRRFGRCLIRERHRANNPVRPPDYGPGTMSNSIFNSSFSLTVSLTMLIGSIPNSLCFSVVMPR